DAALAPDATTGALTSKPGVRPYLRVIVLGLMMLTAGTIGSYSINYMTTYAPRVLHMPAAGAFGVIIVGSVFSVPFELTSGWLSDRFGRKPVMLIPGFILFFSIVPAVFVMSHFHTVTVF